MTVLHPTVLVIAGLDPTGGAGIQADIETLSSLQVHALPIVSCLTVQDTSNVKQLQSIDAPLIHQQINTVIQDISINAIKLGLLSNIDVINTVHETILKLNNIPLIVDPVLKAGGGKDLNASNISIDKLIEAFREKIIPYTTVITPNSIEARLLTGKQNLDDCADDLIKLGCKHVFITGEHENAVDKITNVLYSQNSQQSFQWQRLANKYHGSGCTLASAIAAYLVTEQPVREAVQLAQKYTDNTLRHAIQLGKTQLHPNRFKNEL